MNIRDLYLTIAEYILLEDALNFKVHELKDNKEPVYELRMGTKFLRRSSNKEVLERLANEANQACKAILDKEHRILTVLAKEYFDEQV